MMSASSPSSDQTGPYPNPTLPSHEVGVLAVQRLVKLVVVQARRAARAAHIQRLLLARRCRRAQRWPVSAPSPFLVSPPGLVHAPHGSPASSHAPARAQQRDLRRSRGSAALALERSELARLS